MYYLYIFNIYIISNLYTMYKPQRIKKHHEGSLHILQYIKKISRRYVVRFTSIKKGFSKWRSLFLFSYQKTKPVCRDRRSSSEW